MTSCLIVDDSMTVRKLIHKIVDTWDFDVREAGDGAQALSECKSSMPDLVFLDWNMPVMSGIEFLENLRSLENGAKPVVLFCTTENGLDFIQRGMKAGANEYIMKPFDKTILESKLETLGILSQSVASAV